MKILENEYFQLFQTLVQIGFIIAIIVFVGVAGDTALKIQELEQQIEDEECIPRGAETFGEEDGSGFQGLDINKSTISPEEASNSSAS